MTRIRNKRGMRNSRSFTANQAGVAAVEFALIVPLMLIAYLGATDLTQALAIDRKLGTLAATMSDLTSQDASVDASTVDGYFQAAAAIMRPFPVERTGMQLTVVKIEGSTTTVTGAASRNWENSGPVGSSFSLPEDMRDLAQGKYVVVAKARYLYEPLFGNVFNAAMPLEQSSIHIVRQDVDDFGFGTPPAPPPPPVAPPETPDPTPPGSGTEPDPGTVTPPAPPPPTPNCNWLRRLLGLC